MKKLINENNINKDPTLNAEVVKTPQFYVMYINLIHNYLTLSRSIRTGDFKLFKYVLPKMTNLLLYAITKIRFTSERQLNTILIG